MKFFNKYIFSYYPEVLCVISFFICIYQLDLSWFNTHMSRDIVRGLDLFKNGFAGWQGPEMGWDNIRLPGPAYYIILSVMTLLFNQVTQILIFKIFCVWIAFYFLFRQLKKYMTSLQNFLFLVLCLFNPVFFIINRNLWNPSWIYIFVFATAGLFIKFFENPKNKYLYFAAICTLIGVQIHFSAFLSFLAGLATVWICFIQFRKSVYFVLTFFAVYFSVWFFLQDVNQFQNQLNIFYGLAPSLIERLNDIFYHVFLSTKAIFDYDLFHFLNGVIIKQHILPALYMETVIPFLFFVGSAVFSISVIGYFSILIQRRSKPVHIFFGLFFIIFLFSVLILKYKVQLPYRYGILFYPAQFLILIWGWDQILLYFKNVQIKSTLNIILLSIFCINTVIQIRYNVALIQAQQISGRTHHTANDSLELNLKTKRELYDFAKVSAVQLQSEDPLAIFHGRAINKFRLKEMNWEQTIPYFGLFRMEYQRDFKYSVSEKNFSQSWIFQLNNSKDEKSYALTPLPSYNLPQDIEIQYFDKSMSVLKSVVVQNQNLILPSANIENFGEIDQMHIKFNSSKQHDQFLNLCLDDNPNPIAVYSILGLNCDSKIIKPEAVFKGDFLVQNQYRYALEKTALGVCVLSLKINKKYKNYSKIDLFFSEQKLRQEEINF